MNNSWVQCDEKECDWIIEVDINDVEDWHNKPCPSCGQGVIVNDDDLQVLRVFMAMDQLNKAIDPNEELERVTVMVDASDLRGD